MRLLFLGDIVGPPGVELLKSVLPALRVREAVDVVIANAENATNGTGVSPYVYRQIRAAGVDAVTLGDHIYKKFDIADVLRNPDEPVVKPANFPPQSPGRDHLVVNGHPLPVVVISVMGRTYMRAVDCPFTAVDRVLADVPRPSVILVDMHAEATADKYQMLHHLTGRVTVLVGTHTHVPTADEHITPAGTAFICDVGMCGPHDGILGRRADRVLATARNFTPHPFDVATGDVRLNGVVVDVDDTTGAAIGIRRLMVPAGELKPA